jgi:hypothetical protein
MCLLLRWIWMNLCFWPIVTGELISNCLLLLWGLVATGILTSPSRHYYSSQQRQSRRRQPPVTTRAHSSDGWADVGVPVAAVSSSSNGWLTSVLSTLLGQLMYVRPSLLETTLVTGGFYSSLLCYHCSDTVVVTGHLPMATVVYDPLLQWCVITVSVSCAVQRVV